ncbi:uncharacterized protein LOC112050695 [Bicyclus anynana]|uniref:Uncharacterized protein LOC112050695 n=1 Tax=Bicyclus anynana TaxID=110368 RepID=A0A6J1NAL3_BICAN|nr:uncharacterized protein LOC112050695 [Bicyclus anynana]
MQSTSVSKYHLNELQILISKMPLQGCYTLVLPEFGLNWSAVSRAVRNARLPMTPASVASVLKKHATKALTNNEVADITARLRLKSVAIRARTWYVITLSDKDTDEPVNTLVRKIPGRIAHALKANVANANKKPQVHSIKVDGLIFISVQMATSAHQSGILYVASPPGQDVALVSTLHSTMLRPTVQGLGYRKFEDAQLNGKDIPSLLNIIDSGTNTANIANMPEYVGVPCVVRGGYDFTNRHASREYLSQMFGPSMPILDTLTLQSESDFYDPAILNKKMKVTLKIKADDTFKVLQQWVEDRVIQPTSEIFHAFHTLKSNQIQFSQNSDDE